MKSIDRLITNVKKSDEKKEKKEIRAKQKPTQTLFSFQAPLSNFLLLVLSPSLNPILHPPPKPMTAKAKHPFKQQPSHPTLHYPPSPSQYPTHPQTRH